MRRLLPLFVSLLLAAPAAGQRNALPPARLLDAGLVDALGTIGRMELAGIFSFVSGEAAPLALADYLYRDASSLKKYLRRLERDAGAFGGLPGFDKSVLLYLVGMNSMGNPPRPPGTQALPKRIASRVNELSLKRLLSEQEWSQARGMRR